MKSHGLTLGRSITPSTEASLLQSLTDCHLPLFRRTKIHQAILFVGSSLPQAAYQMHTATSLSELKLTDYLHRHSRQPAISPLGPAVALSHRCNTVDRVIVVLSSTRNLLKRNREIDVGPLGTHRLSTESPEASNATASRLAPSLSATSSERPITLQLSFETIALRTLCECPSAADERFGTPVATKLRNRLADLRAASSLQDVIAGSLRRAHPNDPETITLDLTRDHKMIFCANHPIKRSKSGQRLLGQTSTESKS